MIPIAFMLRSELVAHFVKKLAQRYILLTPTVLEIHPMTPGQGQEYPILGHQVLGLGLWCKPLFFCIGSLYWYWIHIGIGIGIPPRFYIIY